MDWRTNVGDVQVCTDKTLFETIDRGMGVRLIKSIEMVLGFAASGGLVLVLSGGAYAANSGVDTVSQNAPEVLAVGVQNSNEAPIEKAVLKQDASVDGRTIPVVGEGARPGDAVPGVVAETPVAQGAAVAQSESKVPGFTSHIESGTSKKDDGALKNDSPAGPLAASSDEQLVGHLGSGAQKTDSMVDSSTVTPVDNTITVGSRVLEIQPVITTTRAMPVRDLATSVPTATEQAHDAPPVPAPAKSTGLFSRLTSELAGVVVPSTVSMPVLDGAGYVVVSLLFAAGSLLVGFVGLNFGASLRRGGYVHAARSDVSGAFFSLFATPMSLSYVTANQPTQSSFFMVSEIKTDPITVPNAFRKEEMK